jgi:hypothetical protein
MIDHADITAYATQQALAAGVKPETDDFRYAVKQNFNTALRHLTAQVEHADPTPSFFAPPPAKEPPEPATIRSALTSAPVSREIPSSDRNVSLPSRVTLTNEERQIAQASGISDQEYAKNKLKMLRLQKSGEMQR